MESEKIIILICGDRNWKNFNLIDKVLSWLPEGTKIIEGDCVGADKISGYLAEKRNFEVERCPADWENDGNMAGPIRNTKMLMKKPDLVIAFHNFIEQSKGTKDTIKKASLLKIPYLIVTE